MSALIIHIKDLKKHYKPNHLVKVRILGTILDFNPLHKHILIKSIGLLSNDQTTVKLLLEEDMNLSENPQLAYEGTLVDAYGLYNGESAVLLSITVITDPTVLYENRDILSEISSLKEKPLT